MFSYFFTNTTAGVITHRNKAFTLVICKSIFKNLKTPQTVSGMFLFWAEGESQIKYNQLGHNIATKHNRALEFVLKVILKPLKCSKVFAGVSLGHIQHKSRRRKTGATQILLYTAHPSPGCLYFDVTTLFS